MEISLQPNEEKDEKPLSGMKFLVVDDNPILRKISSNFISLLGGTAEFCQLGEEALDKIYTSLQGNSPYDIILMNEYEATRRIREQGKLSGFQIPPIIRVMGEGSTEEVTKSGMDYHITKPLNGIKLLNAIRAINDDNLERTKQGNSVA